MATCPGGLSTRQCHTIPVPGIELCSSELCRGFLTAAVDNLGRVLLVAANNGTVLRMWRAYRDAQMAWMVLPVTTAADPQSTGCQIHASGQNVRSQQRHLPADLSCPGPPRMSSGQQKAAARLQLALVLYAPRKGVVEVWQVEQGPCLCRLVGVSQRGSLLSPSLPLRVDADPQKFRRHLLSMLRQCWLVDWASEQLLDVGGAALAAVQAEA